MPKAKAVGETLPPDAEAAPAEASMPAAVRIVRTAGFIDEFGDRWHWAAGDIVRNPYVIGLLAEHGVVAEILE